MSVIKSKVKNLSSKAFSCTNSFLDSVIPSLITTHYEPCAQGVLHCSLLCRLWWINRNYLAVYTKHTCVWEQNAESREISEVIHLHQFCTELQANLYIHDPPWKPNERIDFCFFLWSEWEKKLAEEGNPKQRWGRSLTLLMTLASLPTLKQLHVPRDSTDKDDQSSLMEMVVQTQYTKSMPCCIDTCPEKKQNIWNICSLHKALTEDEDWQTDQYKISPFTQLDRQQPGLLSALKLNLSHLKCPVCSFGSDNFSMGDWTWATDLESAAFSCSDSSVKTCKCLIWGSSVSNYIVDSDRLYKTDCWFVCWY